MTSTRLAIAALITVGLAIAPFAAEAKKHRSARHHSYGTAVVAPTHGSAGLAATTQPRTYGSSGQAIGTVTAPSIGSYNWPSVGVTNAVPTWRNTNPPVR
ncbi:hypothetical protein [Bradyrhizobium centrolobii]|uniref:hypothetical protein n=1 Tax=Bradyrhizobium centrolobii TaxID=1505087 RepID=UPI0009ED8377|nr:hypothetical protein [Bradyrhizobium centrolobii]